MRFLLLLSVATLCCSTAFLIASKGASQHHPSRLFGISEWRDNVFTDLAAGGGEGGEQQQLQLQLLKPICLLPFSYEEALVQGQTKELRLYEDRFIQLFDTVMDQHEGVVAMALISEEEDGILSSVPLCEVVAFNRMMLADNNEANDDDDEKGGLGIFLTIKCVGRAELKDATQDGPYITADCVEIMDEGTPADLETANDFADGIEKMVFLLSEMEVDLATALEKQAKEGKNLPDEVAVRNNSDEFYNDDDDIPTRMERYQEAYQNALESDTQGYFSASRATAAQRTAQELTAISWAVFSTEAVDEFDAPYRLQALDSEDLVERLKLGLFLLSEKKNLVKEIIQRGRRDLDDEFA